MRINSVNNQNNFKGNLGEKTVTFITKHPKFLACLAGSSVIAQKIVMSSSEAVVGPVMDVGIGKVITKAAKEKDGRTNKSAKVQAVRTFSQAVGGTVVGIFVRGACIAAATAACMKLGEKAGQLVGNKFKDRAAKVVNESVDSKNLYKLTENASAWGKNIGGAVALLVMLVTNFIVDAPVINWLNKKSAEYLKNFRKNPVQNADKEVAKGVK